MKSLQQELRVTKDNLGNIHILRHHFWGRGGFLKSQFLHTFITYYIYAYNRRGKGSENDNFCFLLHNTVFMLK